uniref:Methionine aminopeptidase 1 n=1 Tax=Magallana gigas TaxID=29159 RepID=K1QYJ7_MAGGI
MAANGEVVQRSCETPGCDKDAKLQCPTCIKLAIPGSFFCSQSPKRLVPDTIPRPDYADHPEGKASLLDKKPNTSFIQDIEGMFYHLLTAHELFMSGVPISERQMRGSTNIKILTDEEQEDLRVTCKLGREVLDIAANATEVGITTEEIDRIVHEKNHKRMNKFIDKTCEKLCFFN